MPRETKIAEVQYSLSLLANTRRWPLHRYPGPQLRQHLVRLLIEAEGYEEALVQALVKFCAIDSVLYTSEHLPIRIAGLWMIFQLSRLGLIDTLRADPTIGPNWTRTPVESEVKMLAALMFNTLHDLMGIALPAKYKNATGPLTEGGKAVWEKTEEKLNLARGSHPSREPPSYVGPEVPPEGLPKYEENFHDVSNDYPGSTAGKFEMMITKAMMEMMTGDSKRIWADWEDDKLASGKEVKPWVDNLIKGVLNAEDVPAKEHPRPI